MPQVDVEFELMIGPFNGPDRVTVECALTSPALDPAMHQSASLAVEISPLARRKAGGDWARERRQSRKILIFRDGGAPQPGAGA